MMVIPNRPLSVRTVEVPSGSIINYYWRDLARLTQSTQNDRGNSTQNCLGFGYGNTGISVTCSVRVKPTRFFLNV